MEDDIFIGESEMFEDIRPHTVKYDFHVVKFYRNGNSVVAHFNIFAAPMLGNADYARVMVSTHFIVFLPSSNICHSRIRRRVYKNHNRDAYVSVIWLRGMVPEGARFKCYHYKGGIAIKRDEPFGGTQSD